MTGSNSMQVFRKLKADRRGATAIEYALIASLISLAAVFAFTSLGLNLADIFNTISNALTGKY